MLFWAFVVCCSIKPCAVCVCVYMCFQMTMNVWTAPMTVTLKRIVPTHLAHSRAAVWMDLQGMELSAKVCFKNSHALYIQQTNWVLHLRACSAALLANPPECSHRVWSRNGREGCSGMLHDVIAQIICFSKIFKWPFRYHPHGCTVRTARGWRDDEVFEASCQNCHQKITLQSLTVFIVHQLVADTRGFGIFF